MAENPEGAERPAGGQLLTEISNTAMRLLADYTGRGATRARTVISGDWVFVTLEDTLTKGERKLVAIGRSDSVLATRKTFQDAMRDEFSSEIGRLVGRKVIAFVSGNHLDPDVALEAVMLEPDHNEVATQEREVTAPQRQDASS